MTEKTKYFFDKLLGVRMSRRFWTAVGGVLIILFQDALGIDAQTANGISAFLIAWIVGDSLQKTERLTQGK